MKLYALHDKKAGALSSFHTEKNDAVASRNFASAVLRSAPGEPPSILSQYAEDFQLVRIAEIAEEFDGSRAEVTIVQVVPLEVVITAVQVLAASGVTAAAAHRQLDLLKEA